MVLEILSTYTGPTIVSGGTLQLASPIYSGITNSGWTIQNTSGAAPTISGDTASLTPSGGEFNNLWCNTPMAGLTNQPWTASFTYLDANAQGTDGGQFILQTKGPSARTDGNTAWETVSGYGPMAALEWWIVNPPTTNLGFGVSTNNGGVGGGWRNPTRPTTRRPTTRTPSSPPSAASPSSFLTSAAMAW